MTIQESAEMYLETIYVLSQELEHVRSIDVCHKMNFSKPSVSRAMKNLSSDCRQFIGLFSLFKVIIHVNLFHIVVFL